ncbi:hypothetical protein BHU25_09770 [Pseudomonas vranovensis]|uniref:Uncharacterized protein n=1 Tax=Pseudomonas vranovensis TaxID=321661 RepID=A0A423DS15_9PSED|nr:hypothetical protein BHU25_09770 [Pseudomonas vranovensis]
MLAGGRVNAQASRMCFAGIDFMLCSPDERWAIYVIFLGAERMSPSEKRRWQKADTRAHKRMADA